MAGDSKQRPLFHRALAAAGALSAGLGGFVTVLSYVEDGGLRTLLLSLFVTLSVAGLVLLIVRLASWRSRLVCLTIFGMLAAIVVILPTLFRRPALSDSVPAQHLYGIPTTIVVGSFEGDGRFNVTEVVYGALSRATENLPGLQVKHVPISVPEIEGFEQAADILREHDALVLFVGNYTVTQTKIRLHFSVLYRELELDLAGNVRQRTVGEFFLTEGPRRRADDFEVQAALAEVAVMFTANAASEAALSIGDFRSAKSYLDYLLSTYDEDIYEEIRGFWLARRAIANFYLGDYIAFLADSDEAGDPEMLSPRFREHMICYRAFANAYRGNLQRAFSDFRMFLSETGTAIDTRVSDSKYLVDYFIPDNRGVFHVSNVDSNTLLAKQLGADPFILIRLEETGKIVCFRLRNVHRKLNTLTQIERVLLSEFLLGTLRAFADDMAEADEGDKIVDVNLHTLNERMFEGLLPLRPTD